MAKVSENLKPAVVREDAIRRRAAHGGVKRDGVRTKFCQELGISRRRRCGKSEEAIVAVKRLIPVERSASTCVMLSEKRRELIDENIYNRK